MRAFFAALGFLTIIPVSKIIKVAEKDFAKALLFFPFAGLVIGGILCVVFSIFQGYGQSVYALMVLLVSVVITGALHIDGFADCCDGFYGFSKRERALEIMRDSSLGTMGSAGIVCLLLSKFVLMSSLSKNTVCPAIIMSCVFSRWAQVFTCYKSGYARKEGKAKIFIEQAKKEYVFMPGIIVFCLFLFLMHANGVLIFSLALAAVYIFKKFSLKKIQGVTGDVIGANSEIAEIAVLLGTVLLFK
ncbi:MAG: adenosylcobinamide-GDP ribazoletransferase [Candidatus Omnitrophica bacterium]|nr:adenosylcobinamide-GDP ribazoletransferase [Candidatus Omnitrophota bacterium]